MLFSLFKEDIPLVDGVEYSASADDLCFYTSADDYDAAIQKMQIAIDQFQTWVNELGKKISIEKSCVQYFTRKVITYPPLVFMATID